MGGGLNCFRNNENCPFSWLQFTFFFFLISHSPVQEPSSATRDVVQLNFPHKNVREKKLGERINSGGSIREMRPSARPHARPHACAGLDFCASFFSFYPLEWELKNAAFVGKLQREDTLANKSQKKKKSCREITAFYFLKLQPLSAAPAGGRPPACLPRQHHTLLLKGPDAAQ